MRLFIFQCVIPVPIFLCSCTVALHMACEYLGLLRLPFYLMTGSLSRSLFSCSSVLFTVEKKAIGANTFCGVIIFPAISAFSLLLYYISRVCRFFFPLRAYIIYTDHLCSYYLRTRNLYLWHLSSILISFALTALRIKVCVCFWAYYGAGSPVFRIERTD